MEKLLILGAGGHARSVADVALSSDKFDSISFLDDKPRAMDVLGFPVLGSFSKAKELKDSYRFAFVALGDNEFRLSILEKLSFWGYEIPSLIHPYSFVSRFADIDEGCVVMAGAIVNVAAKISRGCILNTGCTIDHNCVLESGVHVSPGAHIGGDTVIGERTWICVGASIGSQVTICEDCVIAAGAAVPKDITEPGLYAGVPATRKR